ncbi:acyl-CoA carboxylase subunit epsilon [Cryobacterium sp. SO2]|uniref:acyl-CoA carboxylase subunit epsilon n=1 Tax=Cryobacterium sp. SO2 TaxID=1897060 RepID=UPI00223E6965|nr:acyl-CoA carboxylase subunit epsilon [Cryobacterium sp. SO2]WEO78117.1 acyl-CoA carboxylase subunit epsilon [Cryobacterium sp. SO2]
MTDSETHTTGFDPADLTFVTTGVTDQEAAAVTAVLRALLREESDSLRAAPVGPRSAWLDSQRAIRAPLARGDERWRGFTV